MSTGVERKQAYFAKLVKLFDTHSRVVLVSVDNVSSKNMQLIRTQLRGKAVVLMGKNTMIRKALRGHVQNMPALEGLIPYIRGNIGFIFTNELTPQALQTTLAQHTVAAPAKAGSFAQCSVTIPAGNTGLDPGQTNFLQALNIASKIVKGQIEIVNNVTLFQKGDRVGSSEAALLQKLNIKPFTYGVEVRTIFEDGSIYDAALLSMTADDVLKAFKRGVSTIASISLATGLPTVASLPHSVLRGYKKVLQISIATDYTFPKSAELKALLANPEALAAAAKAAASASAPAAGAPAGGAAKAKEPEPAPAEESDEDMGFGLFD